jgi:BolA protein
MKAKIELLLTKAFKPVFLQVVDESHKHVGHAGASQGGHYQILLRYVLSLYPILNR